MKGITFPGYSKEVFLDPNSEKAITKLKKTGANWVCLSFAWFQKSYKSTQIDKDSKNTPSDKSLVHMIKLLHKQGLKIMLMPTVVSQDGVKPINFNPKDWDDWFESYHKFILHYAKIADAHKVALFSVGCKNIIGNRRKQVYWRNLIHEIRTHFRGSLTFSASSAQKQSFKHAFFWPLLDYIGIDAFFQVADFPGSSVPSMVMEWNKHIKKIESWHKKSFPEIPIIFTGIGVCSYDGASITPWKYKMEKPINLQEQANYYESFFQAFQSKKWLKGVFWWRWDNPSTHDYVKNGSTYKGHFTPHKKPARKILKQYFG